jgi:ATP-binding protein involved in chromosome partitioning
MSITKQEIIAVLEALTTQEDGKSIIKPGSVKNIQVFGNEVIIDVTIGNPTLQAKKKAENEIIEALQKLSQDLDIKINVDAVVAPKAPQIKGKEIPGIQNIIAIASGKGGVGKSTVTANLAVTLSKMGFKVGILDADVYGPSIPIMFDVATERPLSVDVNGKSMMKPVENHGVKISSLGFFLDPNEAVIWRGAMASKALDQMIFETNWGSLDFLLIDLPPGTGDIHLSIVQAVPVSGAVIVSTPQNIALADAKKGVAMFKQQSINVPVLGIIENMSHFVPAELPENKYYIFGKDGAKKLAEDIETEFLGEIPIVQSIREGGDLGQPVALNTNSSLEMAFTEITKNMLSQLIKRNDELPPTEIVKITNMSGCSAK